MNVELWMIQIERKRFKRKLRIPSAYAYCPCSVYSLPVKHEWTTPAWFYASIRSNVPNNRRGVRSLSPCVVVHLFLLALDRYLAGFSLRESTTEPIVAPSKSTIYPFPDCQNEKFSPAGENLTAIKRLISLLPAFTLQNWPTFCNGIDSDETIAKSSSFKL